MNNPFVFIIIINWNGKHLLGDCLDSIAAVSYNNFKTLVVDNGSIDNSVGFIRENYQNVEVLELEENLGFAKGNNIGFNHVKRQNPQYVIFLNNDTVVDKNFIDPLIAALEKSPEIGQTCPKIYFHGSKQLIWYAGGTVKLWSGSISHKGIRENDSSIYTEPKTTDYATGCCVCMRTADYYSLNGFSEDYKMYAEDVDLSLRLRKTGKKIYFVPNSIVWHKVSSSIGGQFSLRKLYRKIKGIMRLINNHGNFLQRVTAVLILCMFHIPTMGLKYIVIKVIKR